MKKNNPRMGSVKKKVLLLMEAGLSIGLTMSPKKQRWVLKQIPKEWAKINRQALERAIRSLYASHLIDIENNKDGTTTLTLNKKGKKQVLVFNLEKLKIQEQSKWDGKWRIIMFDVPERKKRLREALRFHFKEIGLIELQKSVLIHPYPCEKEIEFILEFYNARKYVRFVIAEKIDNSLHLMQKFKLK